MNIVALHSEHNSITQKYRPEPGLEPRVSRLAHEYSTTELSRSIQFCYLNFRVDSNYPSMQSATLEPYRVCGDAGVVHVCRLL